MKNFSDFKKINCFHGNKQFDLAYEMIEVFIAKSIKKLSQ